MYRFRLSKGNGAPGFPGKYQQDTPFISDYVSHPTKVEITDPKHPLYGRKFLLDSKRQEGSQEKRQVFVRNEDGYLLKVSVSSTSLAKSKPILSTKLTLESIKEVVTLMEQSEQLWQEIQKKSGKV